MKYTSDRKATSRWRTANEFHAMDAAQSVTGTERGQTGLKECGRSPYRNAAGIGFAAEQGSHPVFSVRRRARPNKDFGDCAGLFEGSLCST